MGVNKTIHFMEVCWKDTQNNVTEMQPSFWRFLIGELEGMTDDERTVPYMDQSPRQRRPAPPRREPRGIAVTPG